MTLLLQIKILSYWRTGGGISRPGNLDATCARDADKLLPVIPGKHLKGLLRDAVRQAHELGWTKYDENLLFGQRGADQGDQGHGARIRVETARLPLVEREILLQRPELAQLMFRTKRSTAINPETGAAQNYSLRFEEVAVPMNLEARLSPMRDAPVKWKGQIKAALPLLLGVGADRTRGLGRCIVTATDEDTT